MYQTVTHARDTILEVFKYIGLKDFKGDLLVMDHDAKYTVRFSTDFSTYDSRDQKTLVDRVLKPIVDAVKNSDAVQDAKAELTSQIVVLQDELDKLNKENERLKEFETYYNLHFKMTNGVK